MDRPTLPREFLAYLLITALFTAILLPLLRPVFQRWVRLFQSSRFRAALSLAAVLFFVGIGGSVNKLNPDGSGSSLRTGGSPALPLFYYDLGYPTADTDGDGIPDYWERRTHTNRLVPDSAADYDHDGVDNAEEFLHQCDPLTKDTDGDGLTDREEIDGAIAGMAGFDPLAQCDYPVDESDANAWDGGIVSFVGVNTEGLPLNVGYPDEADDNVDVLLTVDSTRYAALSWEDGSAGKQLLLPPCTNLPLRLRIPATESSSVSLSAAEGATGLWKAALRAEWDARRGLPIERNRIQVADGAFVDMENFPCIFTGILPGTFDATNEPTRGAGPTRGSTGTNPASTQGWFTRRSIELKSGSGFCMLHGPSLVVTAACENVSLPLEWGVEGRGTVSLDSYVFIPEDYGWQSDEMRITCAKRSDKKTLILQAEEIYRAVPCGEPQTTFVGACWLSSHNPTNAVDHLPRVYEEVVQYFPNCPPTTNTVAVLGWTHDTAVLWIRNLVRILTGDPWDDETDHCFAYEWVDGDILNFWAFVAEATLPYTNLLEIVVDGQYCDGAYCLGGNPKPYHPDIHHVELRMKNSNTALDRMWIVINGTKTEPIFEEWFNRNVTNMAWVATLPRPYDQLTIATDFWGDEYTVDPEPGSPYLWSKPKSTGGNLLHHDAAYSMRAPANAAGHGNQACYRKDGSLIRSGISGGTADFAAGTWTHVGDHIQEDVNPFLHAIHLDGNPCGITTFNNLSRPCLRQGEYIDEYIQCRPVVQP